MTPVSGVIDANIVIGLSKGGVFEVLSSVYSPLFVPTGVRDEILQNPALAGARELSQALGSWIVEVAPAPHLIQQFPSRLSDADRQVLAVARTEGVTHVLSGDAQVLRESARLGITCLRSTDLVALFKRAGLIPSAKAVLDRMRQAGFGISERTYRETLVTAGE